MLQHLSHLDLGIIAAYFGIVFFLAYWVTMKERKAKAEGYSTGDYFLGGRNVGWFVIGASLFASNIGSEHLVGLAGAGAKGDFVNGQFELLASLILLLLGWIFVPFYLKSGVFTMPEFLEKRYDSRARNYLSIVSILAYVLTKISLTILAGAIVFQVMGLSFWQGALLVVIATGIYTVFGGLRAVIYTDMLQMFVLMAGSIGVTYFGLKALGGWEGMTMTIDQSAGEGHNFFNLWRSFEDADYPWPAILFGAPILGIWYWCTDQFIVQRVLSAKNVSEARKGTIFAGFLKILPIFIFVIPGVIAYALMQKSMLTMDASDQALPALITQFLPNGLKGLVLAGLLAALMSSLSSVFNSCSTLFTMDFYKKWHPQASDKKLVVVGQISTLVLVGVSLLWVPILRGMLEGGGSFYQILQSIQAYISPPIAAAFLLGLFFPRLNATGAIYSLWTGFVLGMIRLVSEVLISEGLMVPMEGSIFTSLIQMNFLYYAIFIFVVCSAVMVIGSLNTKAPDIHKLRGVVYEKHDRIGFSTHTPEGWWTVVLILAVLVMWFVFSSWGIA